MIFITKKKSIMGLLMILLIVLLIASDILMPVIGIVGFVTMPIGGLHLIYSALRQEDKRKALSILSVGIILFAFAWEYTEEPIPAETHLENVE